MFHLAQPDDMCPIEDSLAGPWENNLLEVNLRRQLRGNKASRSRKRPARGFTFPLLVRLRINSVCSESVSWKTHNLPLPIMKM